MRDGASNAPRETATLTGMVTEKKIKAARALRQRETDVEQRLWQRLRNRKTSPFKFRRQDPIGPYVADFACPEAKLVIEIDGYWHKDRAAADNLRAARLRDRGYEVVRFEATEQAAISICSSRRSFMRSRNAARRHAADRAFPHPHPLSLPKLEGRGADQAASPSAAHRRHPRSTTPPRSS